jgi:hypothetical protein
MTSMRSPALSWPGTATRRQVPAAPRAVNLFPHLGSALRHADLAHAMRGAAACGTAVPPVRQRAPASVPARSSPPGRQVPPDRPAGSSHPRSRSRSRSRQSRSSRAQAYTAWSVPP